MGEHKPINCFPGYEKVIENVNGKKIVHNMYRGTDLGLGGYVFVKEGMRFCVALVDVSNMHGASMIALNKFADNTVNFADVREANLAIKHGEFDKLKTLMGGKLAKYVDDPNTDWGAMRTALKLVSNSTYGIADATFDNPLRDSRDDNNIVALRGALFMRTLQDEVVNKGYDVIHIKTDSIKIPDATPEIVSFCMEFAKKYDYEFEFEAVYEKLCLVNGSTYIAKYMSTKDCQRLFGCIPGDNLKAEKKGQMWTATAAQFQVPYVFKTLFSHEKIEFDDFCETKSVKEGALYLDLNEGLPDVTSVESNLAVFQKKLIQGYSKESEFRKRDRAKEFLCNELGLDPNVSDETVVKAANEKIASGHNYIFVGRVGQFTPVKDGCGGGVLYRVKDGSYFAATGTKKAGGGVYRWVESVTLQDSDWEDLVDKSYYTRLVDEAVEDISKYGDFEWFVSDDGVPDPVPDFMNVPVDADDEVPFRE